MLLSQQFLLHLVRYRTNFSGVLRQHCTLMTWYKEEHASTANYRIQQPSTNLQHGLSTSVTLSTTDKSSTTLFTLSPKKQSSPIKIGTHTLKEEDEATYLGVTFNKRLAIMRKLAGRTWGANEQILKTVYEGSVRPILGTVLLKDLRKM